MGLSGVSGKVCLSSYFGYLILSPSLSLYLFVCVCMLRFPAFRFCFPFLVRACLALPAESIHSLHTACTIKRLIRCISAHAIYSYVVHMCVYVCMYIYIYIYRYVCVYVYVFIHAVCTHVHTQIHKYNIYVLYAYVYIYICMYVYI